MSPRDTLYHSAAELRSMAHLGLRFSTDPHDLANYQRVLEISARLVATLDQQPFENVQQEFRLDNWAHVSPANGVEAAVLRDGKLLLIQRNDNGLWALPGGLVNVGETLAEGAVRELREETHLQGHATQLLGIFDARLWESRLKVPLYHTIFRVAVAAGEPALSNETLGVAFFARDALPPLSPGHQRRVPVVWELLTGERPAPFFD